MRKQTDAYYAKKRAGEGVPVKLQPPRSHHNSFREDVPIKPVTLPHVEWLDRPLPPGVKKVKRT